MASREFGKRVRRSDAPQRPLRRAGQGLKRSSARGVARPNAGASASTGAAKTGPGGTPPADQAKIKYSGKNSRWSPASKRQSHGKVPAEFADASRGQRLQKVMAEAGIASRRECELYISQGRVRVNGLLVNALPAWVDGQHDRIELDGLLVRVTKRVTQSSGAHVYVLLHKPRGVITTVHDPEGRKTVMELIKVPAEFHGRVFPVGRLDADSTGLLLLTSDGDLAHRLTHPSYEVPKQYLVSVKGRLEVEDLARLRDGLILATPRTVRGGLAVRKVTMTEVVIAGYQRDATRGDRTVLKVTLQEGQNREIRRMMERLGYKVRRLKRIALGPLKLGTLSAGNFRMLTAAEVSQLQRAGKPEPATSTRR